MRDNRLTDQFFLVIGLDLIGRIVGSQKTARDRFMATYGTEPLVVAIIWFELCQTGWTNLRQGCRPRHLLWAFMFLKVYGCERFMASILHCDEKTYRKWVWFMLEGIASLSTKFIKLSNRFIGDTQQRALLCVDGIDFLVFEPRSEGFDPQWFSHKHNGPGVRWELATCINTGAICWFNGPFPCGAYPDLRIFRLGLKGRLTEGEFVWADKGYKGDNRIHTPLNAKSIPHKHEMSRARARHETINGRFTDFGALSECFRHDRNKHCYVYKSAAVITQIEIENGNPPFACTSQFDSHFQRFMAE